jgi:hypothetical protein
MDTHGGMVRLRRRFALIVENHRDEIVILYRQRPNPYEGCQGVSLSGGCVFGTYPLRVRAELFSG